MGTLTLALSQRERGHLSSSEEEAVKHRSAFLGRDVNHVGLNNALPKPGPYSGSRPAASTSLSVNDRLSAVPPLGAILTARIGNSQ